MNLEDVILLFEISKSQKDKYCRIPLTRGTWSSQNCEDRKYNGDFQGEGGRERYCLMNIEFQFCKMNYGDGWW